MPYKSGDSDAGGHCVEIAVLASFFWPATTFSQCTAYSVDVIEGPPCQFMSSVAEARGINEAGALCGGYLDCGGVAHPVIWSASDAITTELPPSSDPGYPNVLHDVNLANQVVGELYIPSLNTPRAFLYSGGVTTNLGTLPGDNWSEAYAINDSGVVCGLSMSGVLHAFVWQDGRMSALNLPYGTNSVANDISNTGGICGWMGTSPGIDSHAFVWKGNAQVNDLGVIPGGTSAVAYGISDNGNVCGAGVIQDGKSLVLHGFFYSNGQMIDIGTLPGLPRSIGRSVNNAGQVVGSSYNESLVGPEIIWQGGVMLELNDLIPPESQISILTAWSINNSGQIVGRATKLDGSGDIVAVRLTPIPSVSGDFNCDRVINTADLLGIINHWGFMNNPGDFNHDGIVNAPDLMIVIQNWTG